MSQILKNIWHSILSSASVNKLRYRKQEVPKGKHSTKLRQRFWRPIRVKNYSIFGHMYGPGLRYEIGSDQTDLNKYCGFYFQPYRPHGLTTMLTYFYDSDKDQMFWTFYHHKVLNIGDYQKVGSVPGYVNLENYLYTEVGEVPDYHLMIIDEKTVELTAEYNGKVIKDRVTFLYDIGNWCTESNLYIGGNIPAQGDIEAQKARTAYSYTEPNTN